MTFPIAEFTKIDAAFGPRNVLQYMPAYEDIPDEFKDSRLTKWNRLFAEMFYRGLSDVKLTPKEGIDPEKAWQHLRCIAASWDSKHEHKEAAFAYLCSQWFEDADWKVRTSR